MTTDAFSLNFSFEDEKNASTPPPAVPDSSEDNAADNLLANESSASETAAQSDPFSFGLSDLNSDVEEANSGAADAIDPFAGFSFGFGVQDDSLDDLPAEVGTVEESNFNLADVATDEVITDPAAELQNFDLEPASVLEASTFPADDLLSESSVTEAEDLVDEEQSVFLEAPEFFENDDVQNAVETAGVSEEPFALEEPIEAADGQSTSFTAEAVTPEIVVPEAIGSEVGGEEEVEPIVLVTPVKITGSVDADDPFAPFIKEPPHVATVAVLGASGIGASHAKWFAKHGCNIVSFLGTSEDSNSATRHKLEQQFGFEGQGYTSLEQLLEETKPEIVCVATPSAFHFVHAQQALEAGAHVLCEKPLTYAPGRKIRENLAGATELIKTAKKKNLLLGTQLQYGAATPILTKLAGVTPEEVGDFAMEIETTNPSSPRDPHQLWIDLGPHAVSIASFLGGDGAILQEDSVQFFPRVEGQMVEASARFSIRREDGRLITVRAICRFAPKEAMWRAPYRRFSFNGRVVSYRGYQTSAGEFAAQFTAPDGYDSHYPDPVDFLVGNFVRAVTGDEELLIDGEFGRQNLEWLLKINS